MDKNTVLVFNRFGMGDGPVELQHILTKKFLSLILESGDLPKRILFYNGGIKLACNGSPVAEILVKFQEKGVELILCQTCLEFYNLLDQVVAGIPGGMPDIIESMSRANKVITL